ncbi:hypothetical protein ACPCBX_34405 [Streptomyces tuirus]|uniref:Uncharacterized protein n=1 Tax=Streptomyces tuirus TaxID=68278 RepID=A0A7G1NL53_9ACTN|nr:hypothetical protein [Streptomyces tuirus]BCL21845.1 hypothetical protein GCM10017668_36880 [Streptomyces tuirus]
MCSREGRVDFLEEVRLRPGMWVNRRSLQHLDSMLTGYRVALGIHGIAEPFNFWTPGSQGRSSEWLGQRLGRHSCLGWAVEIEREAELAGRPAMEMFFEFLDEFRAAGHQGHDGAEPDGHPPTETQEPHASV